MSTVWLRSTGNSVLENNRLAALKARQFLILGIPRHLSVWHLSNPLTVGGLANGALDILSMPLSIFNFCIQLVLETVFMKNVHTFTVREVHSLVAIII